MANSINNGKVVYVEPNIAEDFTAYQSENLGDVYKSVSLEDMSIVVGLQVEVRGRTYETKLGGSDQNVKRMVWQSNSDGEKVSFMQGTKIKTENVGDIYSLTTNYTDTYLYDIMSEGTCEMFGIKSIDVSYNNFMVPEVTIQFIDVRGVSLFAQEEMRHNLSNGEMNGIANNDIEGSFFKCFFTFPYPKFTLFVKGFYGQMVSYELTCSDFRAAFDSNTGNFNVTAKFIGYAFSFLNDVMVNCLVAAPYSEYIGKDFWEKNVESQRFKLEDKNGVDDIPMPKLGYICKMYKEIQQKVADELKSEGYEEAAKKRGYGESDQETLHNEDISPLRSAYMSLMERLEEAGRRTIELSEGDAYIKPSGTYSCCIITEENKPDDIEGLIKEFENFDKKVITEYTSKFSDTIGKWKANHSFALLRYDDYGDIIQDGTEDDAGGAKIKTSIIETPEEDKLRKAIEELSQKTCSDYKDGDKTFYEAWTDGDDSTVYIYKDFGLGEMLAESSNLQSKNEEEASDLKKKIEQDMLNEKFNEVFGFLPTVENITRVVMAHVETFIEMVKTCKTNINNEGTKRSVGNMRLPINQLPDAGGNNVTGVTNDTIVAPFPKVTRFKTDGDATRQEDEWIGNIDGRTAENTEEIKLVEGLLNGVAVAANDIDKAAPYESNTPSKEKSAILYPLTYFDLLLEKEDNPFGNVKVDDVNDVFARFGVRAFSVMATNNYSSKVAATLYGKADAENFLDKYADDPGLENLSNMINSITKEQVMSFFTNSNTQAYGLDKSKKTNPWWHTYHLIDEVTAGSGLYKLSVGDYGEKNNIFPTKNWGFKEIYDKADRTNGIKNSNFANKYITTFSPDGGGNLQAVIIGGYSSKVQYLKNCISALNSSEYSTILTQGMPHAKDFEFSGWGDSYDRSLLKGVLCFGSDGNDIPFSSSVSYDANGDVSEVSGAISLENIFIRKSYLEKSETDRAKEFIKRVFPQKDGDTRTWLGLNTPETRFIYMPKFAILRDAIYLMENEANTNIRPTIIKWYREYFNNWCNNEFKKIEANFKLDIKPTTSIDKMRDAVWESVKANRDNPSKVKDTIHKFLTEDGSTKFDKNYDITITGARYQDYSGLQNSGDDIAGIFLKTMPSSEYMISLVKDLASVISVFTFSKFNKSDKLYHETTAINPYLEKGRIEGYLDGVIQVLKEKIGKTGSGEAGSNVKINNDPDDIKVGVYNYIKMLYDKWLAASDEEDFYKVEKLFEGSNPTFQFIDSIYTKIGKSMLLNLSTLVDRIYQSRTQNGYTLLSMMSGLYADNKFLFLCIQNFLDLANTDMMNKMFRPVSYLDVEEPDNHPNFIVLMPYEPSSKLDVQGADYPDDGFYLNDEASWPEMIQRKPVGCPIPSFGVCYGQQYQNYFKDIQVDMNTPMVTEQSIKAKFMIAGVNDGSENNGPQLVTAGQDLYTIYSNNSYTCTVTMMGCAWVQPMMYFVLQNIPMFRGSYMIVKVNHQIQPGNMITTFKGVRMAKTATRAVEQPILGATNDSVGNAGHASGDESTEGSYANIGNDCQYAYYDPTRKETPLPSNADAKAYCYHVYERLTSSDVGLTDVQAKGVCANIINESGFDPLVLNIDGNDQSKPENKRHHGAGGGLCGFYCGRYSNGTYAGDGYNLFKFAYPTSYEEELRKINDAVEPYWKNNPVPCSDTNRNKLRADGISFPVPYEKQLDYLCHKINTTHSGIKDGNITSCSKAAWWWLDNYEHPAEKYREDRWSKWGSWVESAISAKEKIQNEEQQTQKENSSKELAEGLRKALEKSLHASQYYNQSTVTTKSVLEANGQIYVRYAATGANATNAMFDCLLSSYENWFEKIEWVVGETQSKNDAQEILITLKKTAPSSHSVVVAGFSGTKKIIINITKKDELNESLRLILIKYFKSKNITTASAAKAIFRSCAQMSDELVNEIFELTGDKNSITDCGSVMGKYSGAQSSGKIEGFSGEVTNPLMKKVLSDVNHINSGRLGQNFEIKYNEYHSCCTSGPSTWYNRARDGMMNANLWWGGTGVKTSTFAGTKSYLHDKCGFECVWHGTKAAALQELTSSSLRPGDVCTLHAHSGHGDTSHGEMWTGHDWRSDAIQRSIWVYGSHDGRNGNYSVCLWRHPDFQEPGQSVVPVA